MTEVCFSLEKNAVSSKGKGAPAAALRWRAVYRLRVTTIPPAVEPLNRVVCFSPEENAVSSKRDGRAP
jgi:hypothetical protein